VISEGVAPIYGIEDNSALVIEDGVVTGSITSSGKVYAIQKKNGQLEKTVL
jgi:outer membrane protein assembly factor BamB